MVPLGRNRIVVTAASYPFASGTGTYVHVAPPSFEKSTSSVVLLSAVNVHVSALLGLPFKNWIGPEPTAPRFPTNNRVLAGTGSTMTTALLSTGPLPWLVTRRLYSCTEPG